MLSLDSASQELHVGESVQIAVKDSAVAVTGGAFTFESSNPAVAAVSSTGLITAVGEGSATITVTCGGYSQKMTVTVRAAENASDTTETPEKVTAVTPAKVTGVKVTNAKVDNAVWSYLKKLLELVHLLF